MDLAEPLECRRHAAEARRRERYRDLRSGPAHLVVSRRVALDSDQAALSDPRVGDRSALGIRYRTERTGDAIAEYEHELVRMRVWIVCVDLSDRARSTRRTRYDRVLGRGRVEREATVGGRDDIEDRNIGLLRDPQCDLRTLDDGTLVFDTTHDPARFDDRLHHPTGYARRRSREPTRTGRAVFPSW